jgi:Ser/Thr protein kinase RdoA (MazF antagonist)
MTVTYLPPPATPLIRVDAEIPANRRAEFNQAMIEICAGRQPRLDALEHQVDAIKTRALAGLEQIERAITNNPTSGQAKYLIRFLAGLYNGHDYPFNPAILRALDEELANACLDYLNYDRLGRVEVHRHLAGGDASLHRWLEEAGIEPAVPFK